MSISSQTSATGSTRVLFSCSGIGILNRGIESFFREAFDGLRHTPGLECRLLKGAGKNEADETAVWNIRRTAWLAEKMGRLAGRNGYVFEQWTTFPSVVWQIRKFRPHVVYFSDSNIGYLLYWFRRQIGVDYRLLFSNGGPVKPPFSRVDFVHQVSPVYLQDALAAGEPPERHALVPYGIGVPPPPVLDPAAQQRARAELGLPADRPVVLSVGWISRVHKRMDYVIEEVARMPEPRPFLQLIGAIDATSAEVIALAESRLGKGNVSVRSVPYAQVSTYYRAADCFVLASLNEGFGRVYVEALMHGLPVIAHRNSVTEFVVGPAGRLEDLSQSGTLAAALAQTLAQPLTADAMRHRWESVKTRFDWAVLAPAYRRMFEAARAIPAREKGGGK